jgi:protein phosphatase
MADTTRSWLPLHIVAAGATDIGKGRQHNEDSILLRPDLALYVLADGAGGHNAGNVASALAASSIANYVERFGTDPVGEIDPFGTPRALRRLATALHKANKDILEIARSSNKLKGMGSTVVATRADPKTGFLHVAHVGDSRLYRLRDECLEQLTVDHSLLNDALEMRPDVGDAVLALGMDESVRATARSHRMFAGDKYLLCSDGLTDALSDEDILLLLSGHDRPDNVVKSLIQTALASNAADNIGVIVIDCELAPDAAAAPVKPPSVRPPAMPPARGTWDSQPEIMILDVSEIRLDRGTGGVVVVPAQPEQDPSMLRAIDQMVAPFPPEEEPK